MDSDKSPQQNFSTQKPADHGPGTSAVLTTLAQSPNQWVQLATVGLIALSGLGNWMATNQASDRSSEGQREIRKEVREQIDDVHRWIGQNMDEFHRGNQNAESNRRMLESFNAELLDFERRQLSGLETQSVMLKNQQKILENDTLVLSEVHKIVEKFDRWKTAEQMRGAPP